MNRAGAGLLVLAVAAAMLTAVPPPAQAACAHYVTTYDVVVPGDLDGDGTGDPVVLAREVVSRPNGCAQEWDVRALRGSDGSVLWHFDLARRFDVADLKAAKVGIGGRAGLLLYAFNWTDAIGGLAVQTPTLQAIDGPTGVPTWTTALAPTLADENADPYAECCWVGDLLPGPHEDIVIAGDRRLYQGVTPALRVLDGATGAPRAELRTSADRVRSVLPVGDTDGDGYDELVTVSELGTPCCGPVRGEVGLWSPANGTRPWTRTDLYLTYRGLHDDLGDVSGDGVVDIVVPTRETNSSGVMLVSGASGATLRQTAGSLWPTGDADGDGLADIGDTAASSSTSATVGAYRVDGTAVWTKTVGGATGYPYFETVSAGDLDADGATDALVDIRPRNLALSGASGAALWEDADAPLRASLDGAGDDVVHGVMGPWGLEVTNPVSAFDGATHTAIWSTTVAGLWRSPAQVVGSLDNTGRPDLLIGGPYDHVLIALAGDDGHELWRAQL